MNLGLAASERLRQGGALAKMALLLRGLTPYFVATQHPLLITGGTYDAIRTQGWLPANLPLRRLAPGDHGGFIQLAARVAEADHAAVGQRLGAILYLQDAQDLRTLYPESHAVKRQCVVHQIPFLSTETGVREWLTLDWLSQQDSPQRVTDLLAGPAGLAALVQAQAGRFALSKRTIALIAHDANKAEMQAFAVKHFALLNQFGERVATGTTGARVLEALRAAGHPVPDQWVTRYLSGPMGGDAQIAERVLSGEISHIVFFEDPHVARQHEADILLLERATRLADAQCLCLNDAKNADLWASRLAHALPLLIGR